MVVNGLRSRSVSGNNPTARERNARVDATCARGHDQSPDDFAPARIMDCLGCLPAAGSSARCRTAEPA